MKNTVIIKGNKYGITIVLDKEVAFTQLKTDLITKLDHAEEFFDSDKQLAVAFEGRILSNEEMDELLYIIQNHSKLNIQYVMEQNSESEVAFFDIIQTARFMDRNEAEETSSDYFQQSDYDNYEEVVDLNTNDSTLKTITENSGLFYKGTLRSGQTLEAKDSLIIIGDVNPGANVIAGGNVVVIGSLKGNVTAGSNGNRNAFIMALSMAPIQIQIADVVARSSDAKRIPKSKKEDALIATIVDEQIYMEIVSKTTIHDINI